MANILLTQLCVRSCPYCFAKEYMGISSPEDLLSWDNLIYLADLFEKSGEYHMSLLGGEPLLHPDISDFIIYLSKRNIFSSVFTSGIAPQNKYDRLCEKLVNNSDVKVHFICNVNDPEKSPKTEIPIVSRFLETFSNQITLSFNIYELEFNLSFLVNYINKYNLCRHIRLGLAHPIPGHKNNFIDPNDFFIVGEKLASYYELLQAENIELGFDCGFPLCIFTEEQLGKLYLSSNGRLSFDCGPAIDIGPDMSIWSCFPLSNYNKKSVFDFSSLKEITDFYINSMEEMRRNRGLYEKCTNCIYRTKRMCSGGCIAHLL